jgi:apolipoprotein N-acyltransferase
VASAVLFALAFPPIPLVVPAFVCLVPVSLAVVRAADARTGWRGAARTGLLFGLLGYGITLYWLAVALRIYTDLAFLGFIGALIVLVPIVCATMVTVYAARSLTRWPMAVLLPVVWVASEVLLNYLPQLAFPWLPLGLSVAKHPLLAQAADLSGVRGLSFWIAASNGLIVDAWLLRGPTSPRRRAVLVRGVAVIGLAAVAALYGWWRMSTTRLVPVASVAIVQPNIPQNEKWQEQYQGRIVGVLSSLSRQTLSRDTAQLLLWPEAALPDNFFAHPDWADTMRTLATTYHTPILFGTIDVVWHSPSDFDYYNSAMLADTTGRIGTQPTYHKSYLVPVVERVPIVNPRWFASFKFFGGMGRGAAPHVFDFRFGKVGVLICYESIFLERSRLYRRQGARLLVNITNDAWFGRSIAVYQHEAHLALRAIENRVGIVRDANTGISEYVDPLGISHGATGLFVADGRTYLAQTTDVITPYDHLGDWVGTLSVVATLIFVAAAGARRKN